MASSGRFDLLSGGLDGRMDRGPASAASLERSNSCKETAELRTLPLMSGMQRNGPSISWGDVLNFLLALPADAKQLAADQKLPKEGEIKKLITSALGISHDEPSTSQLSIKAALPSLQDEIRRVKSIFHDNFNKARYLLYALVLSRLALSSIVNCNAH